MEGIDHQTFASKVAALLHTGIEKEDQVAIQADKDILLALASYIDVNQDGAIDIAEFLDAFQVVDFGSEDAKRPFLIKFSVF